VTRVHESWEASRCWTGGGGHQAWSTNIFHVLTDLFPRKALGSVVGIGGMIGSICTIAAFFTLGHVIQKDNPNSYLGAFLVAGLVYLTVLASFICSCPNLLRGRHEAG